MWITMYNQELSVDDNCIRHISSVDKIDYFLKYPQKYFYNHKKYQN